MTRLFAALAVVIAAGAAATYSLAGPDPAVQAQADGCARDAAAIVKRQGPEWAYVGDAKAPASGPPPPAQWASGVVDSPQPQLASHPAAVDLPFTHSAYDVNFNLRPDASSTRLLGGDPSARTGNYAGGGEEGEQDEQTGRLHVEREETSFPPFAWPELGDRVRVQGAWIWDCGHWTSGGERTELHPFWALWVQRALPARSPTGATEADLLVTSARTPAEQQEDCAHTTKGDRGAFAACVAGSDSAPHDARGRYSFFLPAPPRPRPSSRLQVRVLDEGSVGAPTVTARPGRAGATVSFEIPAGTGRVTVAKRVLAGWTDVPLVRRPIHLRVTLERLLVRRAMDPGCPGAAPSCGSVETTRGDQISSAPGEWLLYVDVAGIWLRWPVLRVRDGQTVALRHSLDVYVPRRHPWRVLAFTRECDFGAIHLVPCPASGEFASEEGDDAPGIALARFRSPETSLGEHRLDARLDSGSTCPPVNRHGCYRLSFRVQRVR